MLTPAKHYMRTCPRGGFVRRTACPATGSGGALLPHIRAAELHERATHAVGGAQLAARDGRERHGRIEQRARDVGERARQRDVQQPQIEPRRRTGGGPPARGYC